MPITHPTSLWRAYCVPITRRLRAQLAQLADNFWSCTKIISELTECLRANRVQHDCVACRLRAYNELARVSTHSHTQSNSLKCDRGVIQHHVEVLKLAVITRNMHAVNTLRTRNRLATLAFSTQLTRPTRNWPVQESLGHTCDERATRNGPGIETQSSQ